jgi:hypothetical protein
VFLDLSEKLNRVRLVARLTGVIDRDYHFYFDRNDILVCLNEPCGCLPIVVESEVGFPLVFSRHLAIGAGRFCRGNSFQSLEKGWHPAMALQLAELALSSE